MAVTPLPSKPDYSPATTTMYLSFFSSGTFKLSYAPWHTSQFLSQARATVTDGFMEGQLGADPAFGTCLQCAAVDRARLKTNPVTPRSDICSNCFKKYCYDPQNPPPEGQIVGRRFKFKDPDPFGLKSFYMGHKTYVIIGAIVVVLGLIATVTGCSMFWWRRFQRRKVRAATAAAYQRLSRGDGSEWSARVDRESYDIPPPDYSPLGHEQRQSQYPPLGIEKGQSQYSPLIHEKGESHYSAAGYGMVTTHYAEPSQETAKTYYEEPGDETPKLHYAETSYEVVTTHYGEPSHMAAETHSAEPSYETAKTYHEEPGYETATLHCPDPGYETVKTQYAPPSDAPPNTQYAPPSDEPPKAQYPGPT
jgi:hypothetical protein